MNKPDYSAPAAEVIEVRVRGRILYNSPSFTDDHTQRPDDSGEEDF